MLETAALRPPARARDRAVFSASDWWAFAVCTAINLGTVAWLASRVLPAADFASVVVLLPSLAALAAFEARWLSLPFMRMPPEAPSPPDARVGVATTFVPGVEPLAMLRRTVASLVAMEGPHDTWVLDEGDDPEVRDLCDELGARHFSRKGLPDYQQASGTFEARTKHGNYNAWLDAIGYDAYDIIVGFDPDHVASSRFLARTLGHLDDPGVGYVQAPQSYYNRRASFVARGAAEETYAHYSSVQMTAHALGYPIVTGCHNIHRTTALRDVGGFAAHEADDLLITVHYRAAGWRGVYVPEVLARGITPVDWNGYLTQQRRWARSVLDVKLRVFPKVARRLPPVERAVSALHGLYYLYAVSTALGVASLSFALAAGWTPRLLTAGSRVAAAVPLLFACDLLRQRYYLEPGRERGPHLRAAVVKFAKWPVVLLAIREALVTRPTGYTTTPKVRQQRRLQLLRAHAPGLALLVAAAGAGWAGGHPPQGPVAWLAGAFAAMTLLVLALEWLPAPDPYDDELAAEWSPVS